MAAFSCLRILLGFPLETLCFNDTSHDQLPTQSRSCPCLSETVANFAAGQKMGEYEAMMKLGGAIAALKAQSTTTFEFCAREASQIFGGLSYSRGGQGAKVERLYRDVRAYAIPGGSEEIMLDLSIRQALKVHQVLGMKL